MSERRYDLVGIRQCVLQRQDGQEIRWLQAAYQDTDTREIAWQDVPQYHVMMPDAPK